MWFAQVNRLNRLFFRFGNFQVEQGGSGTGLSTPVVENWMTGTLIINGEID